MEKDNEHVRMSYIVGDFVMVSDLAMVNERMVLRAIVASGNREIFMVKEC